jgi:hypothetical protein
MEVRCQTSIAFCRGCKLAVFQIQNFRGCLCEVPSRPRSCLHCGEGRGSSGSRARSTRRPMQLWKSQIWQERLDRLSAQLQFPPMQSDKEASFSELSQHLHSAGIWHVQNHSLLLTVRDRLSQEHVGGAWIGPVAGIPPFSPAVRVAAVSSALLPHRDRAAGNRRGFVLHALESERPHISASAKFLPTLKLRLITSNIQPLVSPNKAPGVKLLLMTHVVKEHCDPSSTCLKRNWNNSADRSSGLRPGNHACPGRLTQTYPFLGSSRQGSSSELDLMSSTVCHDACVPSSGCNDPCMRPH